MNRGQSMHQKKMNLFLRVLFILYLRLFFHMDILDTGNLYFRR